jgi:proteasome lid subunit RPN8/RPN11
MTAELEVKLEEKAAKLAAKIELARSRGDQAEVERLQATFRQSGLIITRGGPAPTVIDGRGEAPRHRRPRHTRDAALFGHGPSKVELRDERSGFLLRLEASARRAIEQEVAHIRGTLGDREAGGYLFAPLVTRARDDSLTIAAASHAGESRHARSSIQLGDPFELRNQLPASWRTYKQCGDWHTHAAGSTTPSDADMRAWAAWCDELCRARYLTLIVSPSTEGSGWMIPTFSAYETRRVGYPSRFVCSPCHMDVF